MHQKTQRNWVDSINDPTKWSNPGSCAAYNALIPVYSSGVNFTILGGGYQRGKWIGVKNTNWFTCDNWEDFVIPDSTTDVLIPPSGVTNNCQLQKDSTHYCRDLSIQGFKLIGSDTITRVLRVNGNLVITSPGILDFSDGNPATSDGTLYLKGNWSNYDEVAFKQGNSTVILNGSTPQNIFDALGLEKFNNLTVNNTAGINLGNSVAVDSLLLFTAGKISTSSNEMYVTKSLTTSISGYNANNYIVGNLRRQVNSTGIYDFPVGSATNYELATVNLISSTGLSNLIVDFKSPSTGTVPNPLLCTISGTAVGNMLDAGNWTVLPNAVPSAINFDLTVNERGQSNPVTPDSRYGIIRRDNSLTDWSGAGIGTHSNATQITSAGTVTAKRTTISNVNVFGDFAIGFGSGALPVELLSFTAKAAGQIVKLFWQTASESNNDYFVVERSSDGVHFEDLLRLNGAGNSNTLKSYLTEDKDPFNGVNYYKLRQVDFNGDKHFSDIVIVRFNNATYPTFSIFPNPVAGQALISIAAENKEQLNFQLYDAIGKQLRNITYLSVTTGEQLIPFPVADLIAGIYFIRTGNAVVKFVKE